MLSALCIYQGLVKFTGKASCHATEKQLCSSIGNTGIDLVSGMTIIQWVQKDPETHKKKILIIWYLACFFYTRLFVSCIYKYIKLKQNTVPSFLYAFIKEKLRINSQNI